MNIRNYDAHKIVKVALDIAPTFTTKVTE